MATPTSDLHATDGGPKQRTMSRLRAERIIASAQRLALHDSRDTEPVTRIKTGAHATAIVPSFLAVPQDSYLQQSGVMFLLEDLVKQLQDGRPEQIAQFIFSYLDNAVHGRHVRGREFEFVNGTLQNRVALLTAVQRELASVDPKMEITSDDFAELLWCSCSDVPRWLLDQASFHLNETPGGSVIATLQEFLASFAACFMYHDFLSRVSEVYSERVQVSRDNRQSLSGGASHSDSIAVAMAADRVVARLRLIVQQASSMLTPPLAEVEVFVFKSSSFREVKSTLRVMLHLRDLAVTISSQFCALFFSSSAIAASIAELQQAFTCLSAF